MRVKQLQTILLASCCLFATVSCKQNSSAEDDISLQQVLDAGLRDTLEPAQIRDTLVGVSDEYLIDSEQDYADYYIIIADTGKVYKPLFDKMNRLSKSLPLKVNMMDRSYNEKKDLIALPDDYKDDEMYAGDYFPRREPSEYLSLEYLSFYNQTSDGKTIGLIAGIYENEAEADKALTKVKAKEEGSFKMKGNVFVGCMH